MVTVFNPQTIEDQRLIKPGDVRDLMPGNLPDKVNPYWGELAERMMNNDANALNLVPKFGIDPTRAFKHVRAIVKADSPSVEERKVAVAFLLGLWYDDYTLPNTNKGGWSSQ